MNHLSHLLALSTKRPLPQVEVTVHSDEEVARELALKVKYSVQAHPEIRDVLEFKTLYYQPRFSVTVSL